MSRIGACLEQQHPVAPSVARYMLPTGCREETLRSDGLELEHSPRFAAIAYFEPRNSDLDPIDLATVIAPSTKCSLYVSARIGDAAERPTCNIEQR